MDEFHGALRNWIESRLPGDLGALEARYPVLETQMNEELRRAGVLDPEDSPEPPGYVVVKLSRPADYPEALLVTAGATMPCGVDEAVYVYRFTDNSRVRLLAEHGKSDWGETVAEARFSATDQAGNRVFYVSWIGVQCASVWNQLDYRIFRVAPGFDKAEPLFADAHVFTIENEVRVRLSTEELLIELTGEGLEGGYRRTYVLHYRIGAEGVERVDPVALQPQDFVDEWLGQPWSEMSPRSADTLETWHKFLKPSGREYVLVQPCQERPGFTQVAANLLTLGDLDVPEPLPVYFLVEDPGEYHFKMSAISFDRQDGCPGETEPDLMKLPSLFARQ